MLPQLCLWLPLYVTGNVNCSPVWDPNSSWFSFPLWDDRSIFIEKTILMSTQVCAWRSNNTCMVLRLAWVSLSLQYFHRKEGSCSLCLWGHVCAPSHMPAQVLWRPHNSSVRSLWLWGLLPTLEIGWAQALALTAAAQVNHRMEESQLQNSWW